LCDDFHNIKYRIYKDNYEIDYSQNIKFSCHVPIMKIKFQIKGFKNLV